MIIGIGNDLVKRGRIDRLYQRFGNRFLGKILSKAEREAMVASPSRQRDPVSFLAKRYAAKEALLKAIGSGMRAGISWHDMSITNDLQGKPRVTVTGGVAKRVQALASQHQETTIHVTLSDDGDYALAFCVIEAL